MSVPDTFKRATFTPQGKAKSDPIEVHFNPVSLQYSITNTMKEGKGKKTKQFVSQSTGKLTMDLVFDTTHSGEDVRAHTDKIAKFMEPGDDKVPPVVEFQWGTYKFSGMVEAYKETIDFFAASGVPLRAAVNLTMARQDQVFTSDTAKDPPEKVDVPLAPGDDATSTASRGGNPGAGRSLAAQNGQDNMRFPSGGSLTVGASVKLSPPVAFATGGAGIGIGGGAKAGFGVGGGAGIGVGGGAGLSLSAGAGIGVKGGAGFGAKAGAGISLSVGAKASAGVTASAGAFAGLRAGAPVSGGASLNLKALMPTPTSKALATSVGATFSATGQATLSGSASLKADVGANATLRARIQFEEV
jgi:contractile injection system tube protein